VYVKYGNYCPEDGAGWQYWNGNEWQDDSQAIVRCSDCDKFPTGDECKECCDKVMIENFDGQRGSMGVYTKVSGITKNDRLVYENKEGSIFLWMYGNGWGVGGDIETNSVGIRSEYKGYCPEDGNGWQYWSNGWQDDSDANVRCSDCTQFPTESECITCADTIQLTSQSDLGWVNRMLDTYSVYSTIPIMNDRKVYKRSGGNDCIYNCGQWMVTPCDLVQSGCYGYSVFSSPGFACVYDPSFTWEVEGSVIAGMKAVTTLECGSGPPAPPDGAAVTDLGNVAGTIVTYTCSEISQETKAVCDAATLLWIPASIPSDLCTETSTTSTTTTTTPISTTTTTTTSTTSTTSTTTSTTSSAPTASGFWVLGPQGSGDCHTTCADTNAECDEIMGQLAASDSTNVQFEGIECQGRNEWGYGQGFSQCTDATCCGDGSCQYHCSVMSSWPGCRVEDGFAQGDHSRICPCTNSKTSTTTTTITTTTTEGPTACQYKNTVVALKGAIVCKGIEDAESCKEMCTKKCQRWNFKNSTKSNKRTCSLLSIKFSAKKGWTSGQRIENCGVEPTPMSDEIMEDTMSALRTLAVKKKVKNADHCAEACSIKSPFCHYYKWMAKKKLCYLLTLDYFSKAGMNTS